MLRRSGGEKTRGSSRRRRSTIASNASLGRSARASMRSCHRPPSMPTSSDEPLAEFLRNSEELSIGHGGGAFIR